MLGRGTKQRWLLALLSVFGKNLCSLFNKLESALSGSVVTMMLGKAGPQHMGSCSGLSAVVWCALALPSTLALQKMQRLSMIAFIVQGPSSNQLSRDLCPLIADLACKSELHVFRTISPLVLWKPNHLLTQQYLCCIEHV